MFLTNLFDFFEEATKMIDVGRADVVHMAFSKALQKVPHGRLMQRLRFMGTQAFVFWIRSWFKTHVILAGGL